MAQLGTVVVHLYAGLPGEEPQQVGSIQLPLNVTPTSVSKFEVDLSDPLDVIRQTLSNIFSEEIPSAG